MANIIANDKIVGISWTNSVLNKKELEKETAGMNEKEMDKYVKENVKWSSTHPQLLHKKQGH